MTLAPDPSSIFGRIVTGDDVETWCLDLFARWMGTYLSEVERQHGLAAGYWQRPRTYRRSLSFDTWPEDQLPGVMLVTTGLAGPPKKSGDGTIRAAWLVGLAVLCAASTEQASHDMARHYVAAIRALVEHRPSLDGNADGAVWLDETYNDLAYDDTRSLGSGRAIFQVEVCDVTTAWAGPSTPEAPHDPDTDPWVPWPTVQTHDETVVATAITSPLPQP